MKISFKFQNNKLMSDNNATLSQYIISEAYLNAAKEIASAMGLPVIDTLKSKVVFIGVPDMENNDGSLTIEGVVVVRKNNGTFVVSNGDLEYNFEDGDVMFTKISEEVDFCDEFNEHLALKRVIEKRAKFLAVLNDMICDEIESLSSQYESEFGEPLNLSYDDVEDSFADAK